MIVKMMSEILLRQLNNGKLDKVFQEADARSKHIGNCICILYGSHTDAVIF